MKSIISLGLVGAGIFAIVAFTPEKKAADSAFEGVITYAITVDGASNPQAASMMQNATFTISVKSGKSKTTMDFGMGKQTSIDVQSSDSIIMLQDMGGQKYESKMAKSTAKAASSGKAPDIKYLDDTKQIAGYTCHKAQVTNNSKGSDGQPVDIYYTNELPFYEGRTGEYSGLKGFPLEFSSKSHGMTMTFTAKSVSKESLSDDVFAVPAGYTMRSMPTGAPGMRGN